MNKQDLLNKLAIKSEAKKETPKELSHLKSFTIIWSEVTSYHDQKEVNTWQDVNNLMKELYNMIPQKDLEFYHKTKVVITWENGKQITDRLDLGSDFDPYKETVQDYLKNQNGAMYGSNLMQGDRLNLLSWEDTSELIKLQEAASELSKSDNIKETDQPTPKNIPTMLKQLIGIVETIEEAGDTTEQALIKASEQVELCEYYIIYLQSILPILKAKTNKLIEDKHVRKTTLQINSFNSHLN